MSFDDDLNERMKSAAEQAGRDADPSAAASNINGAMAAAGGGTPTGLIAGLAIVGLVIGTVLGATAFQRSADTVDAASIALLEVAVYDCPSGELVRDLHPGDRVFVVGVNESRDWSAFRDPDDVSRTLWLPDSALGRDGDVELPVTQCDEDAPKSENGVSSGSTTSTTIESDTSTTSMPESSTSSSTSTSTTLTPTTTPGVTTTAPVPTTPVPATTAGPATPTPPATTSAPAPPQPTEPTEPTTSTTSPPTTPTVATTTTTTQPPDTTKPTISSATASEPWIFTSPCGGTATSSTLSVVATDNVGVVSVQATYGAGLPGSPINMAPQGNNWTGSFGTFAAAGSSDLITITLTARDAAGNSASTTLVIDLDWCFG